jgi:hypothetical protein
MTIDDVRTRLIDVLRLIQEESGHPEVEITETTCPVIDLIGFDSKMWPVSMGMLADELDIDIPLNVNIYLTPDGKRKLTIGEIAARVLTFAPKGGTA